MTYNIQCVFFNQSTSKKIPIPSVLVCCQHIKQLVTLLCLNTIFSIGNSCKAYTNKNIKMLRAMKFSFYCFIQTWVTATSTISINFVELPQLVVKYLINVLCPENSRNIWLVNTVFFLSFRRLQSSRPNDLLKTKR